MREDLLGYLLGALEPQEQSRIERLLERDPLLRQEVDELAARLYPLDDFEGAEPRDGLAERTIGVVSAYASERREAALATAKNAASSWSLADMVVATGICFAASLLFFPAIAHSRFQAQITACQNNLRVLGLGLENFADQNQGQFPAIPTSGNIAGAGYYAPLLYENQLVPRTSHFVCPGSQQADPLQNWRLPSRVELVQATGQKLELLRRDMGGSYAYTLGHFENGRYCPTRNQHRSDFVIMADAPSRNLAGRRSINHGCCGQNVLFDDFHVKYVVGCSPVNCGDAFYENRLGQVAPGLDVHDSVVADSVALPLPFGQ